MRCNHYTQSLITIVITFSVIYMIGSTSSKGYRLEYGHALRQELLIKLDDTEVNDLIEFVEQYARKRFPWSLPSFKYKLKPKQDISAIKKLKLLYSYDDREPFFYDNTGWDRAGHQYGITRMFTLGTMYSFTMCWKENQLLFTHNFTIVLHPSPSSVNLYSHTFHVQYTNQSSTQLKTFLFPRYHNKDLLEKSKTLRPIDLYYSTEESIFKSVGLDNSGGKFSDKIDKSGTGSCSGDSCREETGNKGEFRYSRYMSRQFKVMSYNIWNMNAFSNKKDGYERRITRLIKMFQQYVNDRIGQEWNKIFETVEFTSFHNGRSWEQDIAILNAKKFRQQTILKAEPDIIGLQEVRYEEGKGGSLGANQIHTMAEGLSQYQYVYQPAQVQDQTLTEGKSEEGVAIMSKYPIISHDYKLLFINRSDSGDMHQRVLLHAQIYIPAVGRVHVLTTHFSLSHVAREQCALQIREYSKLLEGPVILTGDFNAEPHEKSIQYLRGKDVPGQRGVFKDVWETHHTSDHQGYTFSILEKKPTKRIDYIFYQEDEVCCDVESFEVLDDRARGGNAASDHLPLLATFSIKDQDKT